MLPIFRKLRSFPVRVVMPDSNHARLESRLFALEAVVLTAWFKGCRHSLLSILTSFINDFINDCHLLVAFHRLPHSVIDNLFFFDYFCVTSTKMLTHRHTMSLVSSTVVSFLRLFLAYISSTWYKHED